MQTEDRVNTDLIAFFAAMFLTPAIWCAVLGLFWLARRAKELVFG